MAWETPKPVVVEGVEVLTMPQTKLQKAMPNDKKRLIKLVHDFVSDKVKVRVTVLKDTRIIIERMF